MFIYELYSDGVHRRRSKKGQGERKVFAPRSIQDVAELVKYDCISFRPFQYSLGTGRDMFTRELESTSRAMKGWLRPSLVFRRASTKGMTRS